MKKTGSFVVLVVVLMISIFLAINFSEGLHDLWRDIGFSVLMSLISGVIIAPLMKGLK
jgi:uncharacterized membrane protein